MSIYTPEEAAKANEQSKVNVNFSMFMDQYNDQGKEIYLDENNNLIKKSIFEGHSYDGVIQHCSYDWSEFVEFMTEDIHPKVYLLSGVPIGSSPNDIMNCSSRKNTTGIDSIGRANAYIESPEENILMTFDVDTPSSNKLGYIDPDCIIPDTCEEMVKRFIAASPEDLSPCNILCTQSSSGNIFCGDKRLTAPRYHIYIVVRNQSGLNYIEKVLEKKFVISGLGWVIVNKLGAKKIGTLIDHSMLRRTQPILINKPNITDSRLHQAISAPYLYEGGSAFVIGQPLNAADEAKYNEIEARYLKCAEGKSKLVREAYNKEIRKEEKLDDSQASIKKANNIIKRLHDSKTLYNSDVIKFETGEELSVEELLEAENSARFNRKLCWDPAEKGRLNKAIFNEQTEDGKPANIMSFAHGGCVYKFSKYFGRKNQKLRDKGLNEEEQALFNKLTTYTPLADVGNIIQLVIYDALKSSPKVEKALRKFIIATCSSGKTRICLKTIIEVAIGQYLGDKKYLGFNRLLVDYYIQNHELGDEFAQKFNEMGEKAIAELKGITDKQRADLKKILTAKHIKGMGQVCKHDLADEMKAKNYFSHSICEGLKMNTVCDEEKLALGVKCKNYDECEYTTQRDESCNEAVFNILPHDYLFIEIHKDKRTPSLIIVDEDIIMAKMIITDKNKVFTVKNGDYSVTDDIIRDIKIGHSVFDAVHNSFKALDELINKLKAGLKNTFMSGKTSIDSLKTLAGKKETLSNKIKHLEFLLYTKPVQNNVWFDDYCIKIKEIEKFHYGIRSIPMILLDGTGNADLIKKVFGEEIDITEINLPMREGFKKNIHVDSNYRISDFNTKYTSQEDIDKNFEAIVSTINKKTPKDAAVITMKVVADKIRDRISNIILYLRKIRGTNVIDTINQIDIYGRSDVPHDAIEIAARVIFHDCADLDLRMEKRDVIFFSKDGNHKAKTALQYKDPRVQSVADMMNDYEMIQAIQRGRGVWNDCIVNIFSSSTIKGEVFDAIIEAGDENILDTAVIESGILRYNKNKHISEVSGLGINEFKDVKDKESSVYSIKSLDITDIKYRHKDKRRKIEKFFIADYVSPDDYSAILDEKYNLVYNGIGAEC